jgi:hypothetical protein
MSLHLEIAVIAADLLGSLCLTLNRPRLDDQTRDELNN